MKILYGIQGTGNGHISRARAVARALHNKTGVEVDYLFSGRHFDDYFDMEIFGDYQKKRGLTFVSRKGKVDILSSAIHNSLFTFWRDVKDLDLSTYDLVINDFEPISAWAAKRQNIPTIGISHQSAFSFDIPKEGDSLLNRFIMKLFAPVHQRIGLHWYHFNQPILPPIVDLHTPDLLPDIQEKQILVYLPFEDLEEIKALLSCFTDYHFYCFHPQAAEQEYKNISLRPLSREDFQIRMHESVGIIANGGFELPSEAITIGKKLLLKPLDGQFEQLSNVRTLELMGLAYQMPTLEAHYIQTWLESSEKGAVTIPNVAQRIVDWLVEHKGDISTLTQLVDDLWQDVDFPELTLDAIKELHHYRTV